MLVLTADFETIPKSFEWLENDPLATHYSLIQLTLRLKRYLV